MLVNGPALPSEGLCRNQYCRGWTAVIAWAVTFAAVFPVTELTVTWSPVWNPCSCSVITYVGFCPLPVVEKIEVLVGLIAQYTVAGGLFTVPLTHLSPA